MFRDEGFIIHTVSQAAAEMDLNNVYFITHLQIQNGANSKHEIWTISKHFNVNVIAKYELATNNNLTIVISNNDYACNWW